MIQDLLREQTATFIPKRNWWKLIRKYTLILVFLFLACIAVIGCFQQFFDNSIRTYNQPGGGLEICSGNDAFCFSGHYVIFQGGSVFEIQQNVIDSWSSAWSFGPFYGLFVFPFSWLTLELTWLMGNQAWSVLIAILIIVLIVRLFVFLLTLTPTRKQYIMQSLQVKIAEIKAKYEKDKKRIDQHEKQKMQLEIMKLYRKYEINPLSMFTTLLVSMPFFYTMYRVFASVFLIKATTLGPFAFQDTILQSVLSGNFVYLGLALIVVPIQLISFKINSWLNHKQVAKMDQTARAKYKKSQLISNIMVIFFAYIAISVPLALSFYWAFSGIVTIIQTLAMHNLYARRVSFA